MSTCKFINVLKISLIAILFTLIGCNIFLKKTNRNSNIIIQNENWEAFNLGDINKDGVNDTAFVYTPKYYESNDSTNSNNPQFERCVNNNCFNKIKFSTNFKSIYIKNSLWGRFCASRALIEFHISV